MPSLNTLFNTFANYTRYFNASLPIGIEVLDVLGNGRYKLKVGHKEMVTKSLKILKKSERYWGNLSESKDGILTINTLRKKPALMQNDSAFILVDSFDFLTLFLDANEPSLMLKNWLLEALASCEDKNTFNTLSSMLLALHEGTVHLPLKIDSQLLLLQWRENQNLNEALVNFYIAYDNLGAIKGEINIKKNFVDFESLFERTTIFLSQQLSNAPFRSQITTNDNLVPLWDGTQGLLDIKG
jgi:hypothetical protein